MIVLGRVRVSTTEQTTDGNAIAQQTQRLLDAGATEISQHIGSGSEKKQLKQLMDRCERGDVEEIVATRIDRITRSLIHLQEFAQFCLDRGINLRILDQQIDLKTPHGKLMLNVIGSLAQWEIDLLRDRINHGWDYARRMGRAPGNIPFGYININNAYAPNHNKYFDTDKTIWQVAREVVEKFLIIGTARGTTRAMFAVYGNRTKTVWNSAEDFPRERNVTRWLMHPALRGHTAYFYRDDRETVIIPNTHEPLLTEIEYEEIVRLVEFAKINLKSGTGYPKPLTGLVFCDLCGSKFKAHLRRRANTAHTYWYCRTNHIVGRKCENTQTLRGDRLEEEVISAITSHGTILRIQMALTTDNSQPENPEIKLLQQSIDSLFALPQNPAISEAIKNLNLQIETIKLRDQIKINSRDSLVEEFISSFQDSEFFRTLDPIQKRSVYKRFIKKVFILEGHVHHIDFSI